MVVGAGLIAVAAIAVYFALRGGRADRSE